MALGFSLVCEKRFRSDLCGWNALRAQREKGAV
jgi:hypothetical protein